MADGVTVLLVEDEAPQRELIAEILAREGHEIREACGAGASCGGCRPAIDRLVELHGAAQDAIEARGARG